MDSTAEQRYVVGYNVNHQLPTLHQEHWIWPQATESVALTSLEQLSLSYNII